MDENKIKQIALQVFSKSLNKSQFSVSPSTFHKHTGDDSPRIAFLSLSDVPKIYRGNAGKATIVNPTATGLIFGVPTMAFTQLSDVPTSYSGKAGQMLQVNSGETALEFTGSFSGNNGKSWVVNVGGTGFTFGGFLGKTGSLFDHYSSVANGTTVETTLYTDTIVGTTLAVNGDKLEIEYGGTFVSSATATRQIKIYFAGTVIFDTGALTLSLSSAWTAYVTIIRVSASVVRYMISFTTEGAALAAYTNVGELTGLTLTNDNILKITGQAAGAGAASNDITAIMGYVKLTSASSY